MNLQDTSNVRMSENVIIADADYIDNVAFQLTVQFERMIGRAIPPADLSQWIVNIALDGGLREDATPHETQVVLVHHGKSRKLDNFRPSDFETELNAQAFKDDHLGEFLVNSYAVGEMVSKDEYILDVTKTMVDHKNVKRLMIIPNGEEGSIYDEIRGALRNAPEEKHITVFAMQPMSGGNFRQEILGYSLMNAMGIRAEELK
ncbi:MAG: DUF6621 family protein [Prevotella sp.]